ncbi:hypothetical protein AGABI2DRAFT_218607, partial [Agaricus bisporus var. bisporus H97]|uniref:hypothetical protein n=1 Tax=Agaricus bisporus var. bisporus (strain H97 / ATCC MYA-4626 / FGSC 10389) TaxID=936046 RepID=UPI00029F6D05
MFKGEYRKRNICVKAVRVFQKQDNSRLLQTMAKEAVLWAHLTHGNILPFYGVYIQQPSGRICIISPWMDRGDLSAYLSKFPDTPRLPLVRDVIAGLRYLHASDIVHGDLKAKNVLMSDNGCALIADFGISYLLASANTASFGASSGTTRWKAPELAVEGCLPTLQSDMWSFGCLCHEVFTCKVPFCDLMNDYQILFALMKGARRPGDVNQFDGFSIKGRELVKRCWDYEPGSRPRCEEI